MNAALGCSPSAPVNEWSTVRVWAFARLENTNIRTTDRTAFNMEIPYSRVCSQVSTRQCGINRSRRRQAALVERDMVHADASDRRARLGRKGTFAIRRL